MRKPINLWPFVWRSSLLCMIIGMTSSVVWSLWFRQPFGPLILDWATALSLIPFPFWGIIYILVPSKWIEIL